MTNSSPVAFDEVLTGWPKSERYGEHWGRNWLDVVRLPRAAAMNVMAIDALEPIQSIGERQTTTSTTQAVMMMNSRIVRQQAEKLALQSSAEVHHQGNCHDRSGLLDCVKSSCNGS